MGSLGLPPTCLPHPSLLSPNTECMFDYDGGPLPAGRHTARDTQDPFDGRPRTYKPARQRVRSRGPNDQAKTLLSRRGVVEDCSSSRRTEEEMSNEIRPLSTDAKATEERIGAEEKGEPASDHLERDPKRRRTDHPTDDRPRQAETHLERTTLCLPNYADDSILHGGQPGFQHVLSQYVPAPESNAAERLVALKARLRKASTHDFWGLLMEEMCEITGAQCGFVAKRMLVDDQHSAVEMPELGEPGSCLMGVAFYLNHQGVKQMHHDYRYHAYGTPCAYMKHDKVFIVPERMDEFIPNNPNEMPWAKSEAFIGVPLFSEDKCFAHFGMIWSSEGMSKRTLGWGFIEMFLHSLEDMILQRIVEGRGFVKEVDPPESIPAKIIPLAAITASQSLKPYAQSLSHELRTPMQGVVGMLDIMYSTVVDAIATQQNARARAVFEVLKGHIEVVQDSSKRAVEAADNVVHAYDLNMQMPETPLTPIDWEAGRPFSNPALMPCSPAVGTGSSRSPKRPREEEAGFQPGPPLKKFLAITEDEMLRKLYKADPVTSAGSGAAIAEWAMSKDSSDIDSDKTRSRDSPIMSPMLSSSLRRVVVREFMRSLVEGTIGSGHPTSEIHTETALGEAIEFKMLGSRGEVLDRTIHLSVATEVPEVVITEEAHLHFSLQKVVDNAIKFTEKGDITISVKLGAGAHMLEIWVIDTGCGISEESKLSVFTPHFQQDTSRSRSKDGLGLSLFNAKAHVRRNLGGDVTLERSATSGPFKGSEFLIRLPISSLETGSPETPLVGTPPGHRYGASTDTTWSASYLHSELSRPGTPSRRASPPIRDAPRRGLPFNPHLAKQHPLNILIAEDNAINRNVAVGTLNKLGYARDSITLAFDGAEAVRLYAESLANPEARHYDAILMDIWMPHMDGYEATTRILELAEAKGQRTTVVAVTADITGDSVERAKKAGMHGFLAKPYKVLDIEHLILEHFGNTACC